LKEERLTVNRGNIKPLFFCCCISWPEGGRENNTINQLNDIAEIIERKKGIFIYY
jgi:hypothetical protein